MVGLNIPNPNQAIEDKEAAKRRITAWCKDNTKRFFALSGVVKSFTKERIQEMIGEDLVVTDGVFKILTTFSGVQLQQFAPKKGVWGNSTGKGTPAAANVTFQDRFAALTRGFEVVLVGNVRAEVFLQELRDVRQLLFAYAAKYQDVLAGELGPHISQAVVASIDEDFVDVTKGIGDVAYAIKSSYPNGPPLPGQPVMDLPPPVFTRTRDVTDRIRGVQRQVILQSRMGATIARGGEGGGSLGKRKGTVARGALQSRQPAKAAQAFGSTLRVRELEESACPRGTCIHHWKREGCPQGDACRFFHDKQTASSSYGGGGGFWRRKRRRRER